MTRPAGAGPRSVLRRVCGRAKAPRRGAVVPGQVCLGVVTRNRRMCGGTGRRLRHCVGRIPGCRLANRFA